MKKYSLMIGLFLMTTMIMAQEKGAKHNDRFEHLKTKLNLNEEQAKEVKQLLHAHRVEMKDIRKQHSLNAEDNENLKAEMAVVRQAKQKAFREDLRSILDEEQLATLDQMTKRRRANKKRQRFQESEQTENKPNIERAIVVE